MTAGTAPESSQSTTSRPVHAPADYRRFLATRTRYSSETQRKFQRAQERFQEHFPDLLVWFDRPLRERVGWRGAEQQARRSAPGPDLEATACWINFRARSYLLWLSFTGRLRLDWGWLLGVGVLKRWRLTANQLGLPLVDQVERIVDRAIALGLSDSCREHIRWGIVRLVLHRGDPDLSTLTVDEVEALRDAIRQIRVIPGFDQVLDDQKIATTPVAWATGAYQTGVALFHAGMIDRPPRREKREQRAPLSSKQRVMAVMHRYVAERALVDRPSSISQTRSTLRRLGMWLDAQRPEVTSLAELHRSDLVECLTWLHDQPTASNQALSPSYYRTVVWQLVAFFRHISQAEWEDAPVHPLLLSADIPRTPLRVPRYIPREQLDPLMAAIRELDCPLQRAALLVARWSGARRSEIRRLHLDCLDAYPDGTPRLRLAIGKSRKERMVPVHQEAADAIRALQRRRRREPDRGMRDPDIGHRIRYLFVHQGRLASPDYLFGLPLADICSRTGLVDEAGRALVTPHRFRHTLGTQLAEQGARTRAIMAILGHQSANMSMTYAAISDAEVLRDYQTVLGPGAVLAGPQAEAIRQGAISEEALDWLKTNFYKTELELGRCLRLPQEGPCECDLYLSCAKFVTTREYAPRLRERLVVEQDLVADAEQRGWGREVERHERIAQRIHCLLADLGESDLVS